jgi:hypothetical protein
MPCKVNGHIAVYSRSSSTFNNERVARSLVSSTGSHATRAGWWCLGRRRYCIWPIHILDISAALISKAIRSRRIHQGPHMTSMRAPDTGVTLENMPVTVWDGRGRAARHDGQKVIANQQHRRTESSVSAVGPTVVEQSILRHLVSA